MKTRKFVIGALVFAMLGLSGCESNTQADYIALQKELSEVKLELIKTQDALRVAERELASLQIEEVDEDFSETLGKVIHNKDEKIKKIEVTVEVLGALIEASYSSDDLENLIVEFHEKEAIDVMYIYFGAVDDTFTITPQIELPEDYRYSQRPGYLEAVDKGIYVAEPYIDAIENKAIQTITKALYVDGQLIGVLGIDAYLD